MSRFATPNKTRSVVLAKSPSVPVQREPGFRYGSGSTLPGASIKGRHMNEVVVDCVRKLSPSSTSRHHGPTSTMVKDNTVFIEESDFLPLSTRKPFEKPEREDRQTKRKDATPITSSRSLSSSPQRATLDVSDSALRGLSVNADVVTVNRSQQQHQRSSSPLSSAASVRSLSSSSATQRSQSTGRVDSIALRNSRDKGDEDSGSVVSAMLRRALTPTRLTSHTFSSSLSKGRDAAMFQPLASSSSSTCSHSVMTTGGRSLHHLQLSQSSFKSVRKALVRSELGAFLTEDADHRDALQQAQHSSHPHVQLMRETMQSLVDFDESEYGSPAISNPLCAVSPGADTSPSNRHSNNNSNHARKRELKKHNRLMQMTSALREAILEEIAQHKDATPETIFFPCEHARVQSLALTARMDMLSLAHRWQRHFLDDSLPALDLSLSRYRDIKAKRNEVLTRHSALRSQLRALEEQRETARKALKDCVAKGEQLGLDFSALLRKFPSAWMHKGDGDVTSQLRESLFISAEKVGTPNAQQKVQLDQQPAQPSDDQDLWNSETQHLGAAEGHGWVGDLWAQSHALMQADEQLQQEQQWQQQQKLLELQELEAQRMSPEVNFDVIQSLSALQ